MSIDAFPTKRKRYEEVDRLYQQHSTRANALKWHRDPEQLLFCEALLDLSESEDGQYFYDYWISRLEARFERFVEIAEKETVQKIRGVLRSW